jgi:hypothetical protein
LGTPEKILNRAEVVSIQKVKTASSQCSFATEAEAETFKRGLQADGYIASIEPVYPTKQQRDGWYRRRQTVFGGAWPPQARTTR